MNDRQVNKLRSFIGIAGVMEEEKTTIEKYPLIKSMWGNIDKKVIDLKAVAVEDGANFTGITLDKNDIKYKMAKLTATLAGCVSSYAKNTNNKELATITKVSKDTILKKSEELMVVDCKNVLIACEKHIDALQEYMVTTEDVEKLRNIIAQFEELRKKRTTTNSTSKVNTEMVDKMIKEISYLLKEHLDKYINKVDEDEPILFSKYYAARTIRDLGGSKGKSDNGQNTEN